MGKDQAKGVTCVRLVVTGRVQGVYFRSSLREVAHRHGVQGWVRNNPDGSVEALLQGRADSVRYVLDWAHHGPPGAVVNELKTELLEPSAELNGFQIRYY